jgi:hypothetical protein
VQIALAGAERHVEVRQAPRCDVERRSPSTDHAAVEDDRRSGPASVPLDQLDDRPAARLLLAVACEPHVDRQRTRPCELPRRGEQHVQLPLVIHNPAGVEVFASDLGLKRLRLPEPDPAGRLHVEMPVAQDGRGLVGLVRGAQLPDRQRLPVPVDQLGVAARAAQKVADPLAGAPHVGRVPGVGADR